MDCIRRYGYAKNREDLIAGVTVETESAKERKKVCMKCEGP